MSARKSAEKRQRRNKLSRRKIKMFETGEKIVYGPGGVCTVTGTCVSPFGGGDLRVYYKLQPLDENGSVFYTPAEGGKAVIRPLVTREEAEKIIAEAPECVPLTVEHEKQRRDIYRAAIATADPREYIRLIITVEHRRINAMRTHRHIAVTDTEFERTARYSLFSELAIVLDKSYGEIERIFRAALAPVFEPAMNPRPADS